ncbi:AraC family transcriptional regulator [Paenibacillus aceris]|uniref:AraC-like DNA-binding protein n=1 Tax=Paenibacillus aceris TaxID=869555 RepID=A0ABS4I319_9BACL|nr:AraC family transcriptional regulator [Paenibacillus aceris]MBP1965313.1 AraC-like DNA-binding protein [Paenibacillus aceris]NHW35995.1 helix-turn-helix transcriptional regulator [Paenibacillus aceris]
MLRFFGSSKYFHKIYLWIGLAFLSLLIIFSTIIYLSVKKSVLQNNYDLNKQLLSQVANNLENFDQMVRNLCYSIYMSSDTKSIFDLNNISDNIGEASAALENLRTSYMSNGPFIHSIFIHHGKSNVYLSTNKGLFSSDPQLETTIRSFNVLPVLKPIYRQMDSLYPIASKPTDDVFTYAMYDWLGKENLPDNSVYVNIKADWMLENINRINTSNPNSKSNIYILNGNNGENIGNQIKDETTKSSLQVIYSDLIKDKIIESGASFDAFSTDFNGEKSYVSYIYLKQTDWVLVKVQSYKEVFRNVENIKFIMLFITLVFIFIAVIASFAISKKIYVPIGKLVKRINSLDIDENEITPIDDEISFLNQMYNKFYEYREMYYKENRSKDRLLNNYYLTNLLVDSNSMTNDDIANASQSNSALFDSRSKLTVCVIKIDQYNHFVLKSSKDQELLRFAIVNIMNDLLASKFYNEAVDMKKDQIVLIVNTGQAENNEAIRVLSECLAEAQKMILKYFKLSVSVSIGEIVDTAVALEGSYRIALYNANYRTLFGRMSVITCDKVKQNNENSQVHYSAQLNKKLVEAMNTGQIKNAEMIVLNILEEIKEQNYNNMTLSVMHITNFILNMLNEMNKSKLQPINIDYNVYNLKIMEYETLEEISEELIRLLSLGVGNARASNLEKHALLIETAKGIIEESYSDPSLSLQLVAEILKMSSVHLGKIFKENMSVSLAEYIHGVRLEKARELLEQSNFTTVQIIEKIGMENESYFYKLFKKKYGVTPKEYVLKNTVMKS